MISDGSCDFCCRLLHLSRLGFFHMHPPGNLYSHANSCSKQLNGFGLTVCDLICDILYFPLNISPGCEFITIVYIIMKRQILFW